MNKELLKLQRNLAESPWL